MKQVLRVCAIVAVLALPVGLAACGSDDDSGGDSNAAAQTSGGSAQSSDGPATDEDRLEALYARMQKAFYSGDGKAVCAGMTAKARAEGKTAGTHGTCERNFTALGKSSAFLKDKAARIVSVKVNGKHAVIMTRVPGSEVPPEPVRYIKQGGDWKLEVLLPTS